MAKIVAVVGGRWYDEVGVCMMGFAFGKLLRAKRRMAGLSLTETARRAKVSHSYLSQLETGQKQRPSDEARERLCSVLGIKPEELAQVDWNSPDRSQPVRAVIKRGSKALDRLPDLLARVERLVVSGDNRSGSMTHEDAVKILAELKNVNRTVLPLLSEMRARLEPVRSKDLEALVAELERLGPAWVKFVIGQVEGVKKLLTES